MANTQECGSSPLEKQHAQACKTDLPAVDTSPVTKSVVALLKTARNTIVDRAVGSGCAHEAATRSESGNRPYGGHARVGRKQSNQSQMETTGTFDTRATRKPRRKGVGPTQNKRGAQKDRAAEQLICTWSAA